MKGFTTVCVFTIAITVSLAIDEAAKKKAINTFNKCKEQHPITDAELEQIKKHEGLPSSQNAKCLAKCMLTEGNILKDGKYKTDIAIAFTETLHSDNAEEAEKARQVVEHCASTVGTDVGSDACEYAYKMAQCGYSKAKEIGLEKPEWE
uniref:Putative odorant-binding protein n=1 Tax=Triatoma brasiliensis TaxID=65344 RepID=A0A162RQE5_TRIBS|nr:putative odorant-binding protein [Triatoma brasiliensis]